MKTKIIFAMALLSFAVSSSPTLACSVPRFPLYENQTAPAVMYAFSGKRCGVTLGLSRGPTTGARIVSSPKHGRLAVSGYAVRYTSARSYVGDDRFSYALIGEDELNRPVTYTVEMTVHVAAPPPKRK